MVVPTQVPLASVPVEAQTVLGVPQQAVPPCTVCVHVAAQQKPELVGSRKDELCQLIDLSTQQFESS
jgi:hypothetical protein